MVLVLDVVVQLSGFRAFSKQFADLLFNISNFLSRHVDEYHKECLLAIFNSKLVHARSDRVLLAEGVGDLVSQVFSFHFSISLFNDCVRNGDV